MAQEVLEIRRPNAALLTAAVLVVGILFGVGVTASAGHPVFGAQKMLPINCVAREGPTGRDCHQRNGLRFHSQAGVVGRGQHLFLENR